MAKSFSENYFFVDVGDDPGISVEGHEYALKDAEEEWKERNGKIRISCEEFELAISLPKKDLKELITKADNFLKKGKELQEKITA